MPVQRRRVARVRQDQDGTGAREQQVFRQVVAQPGRGGAALPGHDEVAVARLQSHAAVDVVVDQARFAGREPCRAHERVEVLQRGGRRISQFGAAFGQAGIAARDHAGRDEARDARQRAADQVRAGRLRQPDREPDPVGRGGARVDMDEYRLVAHDHLAVESGRREA